MTSDERPYGIWLWCILLVFILGYVVVADWWLHSQGHEFMTTEFKEGLDNTVWSDRHRPMVRNVDRSHLPLLHRKKVTMPFQSEQQRRFMWAQHPDIAEKWAHGEHSTKGGNHRMPKRAKSRKAARS
jgi:hypothetical protein